MNLKDLEFSVPKILDVGKLQNLISCNDWFNNDIEGYHEITVNNLLLHNAPVSDGDIIKLAVTIAQCSISPFFDLDNDAEYIQFVQLIAYRINHYACDTFYQIKGV